MAVVGLAVCVVLFAKAQHLRVYAIVGGIACLMLFFASLGAAQRTATAAVKAETTVAAARKAEEERRAQHSTVVAQLAALPATAKQAELLVLCEKADDLGGVPADQSERCGSTFFTMGQTVFASGKAAEGAALLNRASRVMPSKTEEVTALLAKAKLEEARQGAQGLLKESQTKLAASDLAGATAAVKAAQAKTQEVLSLKPGDKASIDLASKLEAHAKKIEKAAEAEAEAKERARYIKESCSQLSRLFGPESRLSDLQKEEAWKQYEGKEFSWDLQVVEVSSGMLGGYTVQFKCGRNSPSFIQDIQLSYPSRAKAMVMQLEKGAVYQVKGKLKHSSTLLGMTADPI
jgi:hypothetical protein